MPLNGCTLAEWSDYSFFLEMKPRTELASLFVDCPPPELEQDEDKENPLSDQVRVGKTSLSLRPSNDGPAHSAKIENLHMQPESLCAPTWADNNRLFMCKVHAEADDTNLVPKTYPRLARDMCSLEAMGSYAEECMTRQIAVECSSCGAGLVKGEKGDLNVGTMPSDDWLNTSPGIDFYCRDSCGPACDPARHTKHGKSVDMKSAHSEWLPDSGKILISHCFTHIDKETAVAGAIELKDRSLSCAACKTEIGIVCRTRPNVWQLHHGATALLTDQGKAYLDTRFTDISQFLALVILNTCEAQSSQKVVVRTLDKTPHLLVWLLDSYVVMTGGRLFSETADPVRPFPALKMLYKVFDENSAASDPRANGEDASVGILELPDGVSIKIVETLLRSTHALPPACRSVGQFYVGFLKLSECVM